MKAVEKAKRSAGRPSAFCREEALECAIKAFWKHGYDGTDMEQIAAALGVAKPSIYRKFGSKEQLFVAAMKYYAEKTAAPPRQVLEAAPTIAKALANLLELALSAYTQPGQPQGCFLACVASVAAEEHPDAGRIFLESTKILEATIANRFARAVKEGELPKKFPVQQRAQMMTNLLNAYSLRARAGESHASLLAMAGDIVELVIR